MNNKITRQAIADEIGVSKKTIERYMKEIKIAYSKLLKKYNPEDYPDLFIEIQEAYETALKYSGNSFEYTEKNNKNTSNEYTYEEKSDEYEEMKDYNVDKWINEVKKLSEMKNRKLEEIKMESESRNKDKLLIERANRIYSEISSSEIRSYISGYLEQYEMILKTDNKIRIKKAKKEFSEFLDKVDPELSDLNIDEILKDKEVKKEMEIEEDDDDLGFLN